MSEATLDIEAMKQQSIQGMKSGTDWLISTLQAVPDDKLTFRPSETAKPALQLGAHIVVTNYAFVSLLNGEPTPDVSLEEFFAWMSEEEKKMTTREEVVAALEASTEALASKIGSLTAQDMSTEYDTPFGKFSVPTIVHISGVHAMCHAAQIDYLQTIWGDMEMHMGH